MKFFSDPKWWKKTDKWYFLFLPTGAVIFFIFGILFWGGFNWSLEITNTEKFCVSCHEMEIVYEEYKESPHYNPVSGVSASCPDCHVPRPYVDKLVRKVRATNELWHKMLGSISTPEKFEAKRYQMAEHVWGQMKANDSRECRDCHLMERMNLEKQSKRAKKRHDPEKMAAKGQTCIDCHKGIAHKMPEEPEDVAALD